MGTGELNAGGNPAMDWNPIQGGIEILLVVSWFKNRDKLRPNGPLGSYADFTYHFLYPTVQTVFSFEEMQSPFTKPLSLFCSFLVYFIVFYLQSAAPVNSKELYEQLKPSSPRSHTWDAIIYHFISFLVSLYR